jgi:hypothetical protein
MKGRKKEKVKKAGLFPYLRERFSVWCNVLRKPSETFAKEKKNATLMQGAKDIVTLPLVFTVTGFILTIIISIALGEFERSTSIIPIAFLAFALGSCIALLAGWLIFSGIGFEVAKLLGGKGTFKEHAYCAALWQTSTLPFVVLLSVVPFLYLGISGFFNYFCNEWDYILIVAFLIQAAAVVWALRHNFIAIQALHKLGNVKSAISALISPGIAVVLAILLLGMTFYAIRYYSGVDQPPSEKALHYAELSSCRVFKGDMGGALAKIEKALEIEPDNAAWYVTRGEYRYDMGDKQGASSDFNKAIEVDPTFAGGWALRGYVKYKTGDIRGYEADIAKAHELEPMYPDYIEIEQMIANETKKN